MTTRRIRIRALAFVLILAGFGAAWAGTSGPQHADDEPRARVVFDGPLAGAAWLEHDGTGTSCHRKGETDPAVRLGLNHRAIAEDQLSATVYEHWVVIEARKDVFMVPREKVLSLRFSGRK